MRIAVSILAMMFATSSEGSAPIDQETLARGREQFAACAVCHTANKDIPNAGPELRGIIGRAMGTYPGFRYSRAMRTAKRGWTVEALDEFLADPQAALPGNTMPFPGIPDEKQRHALIAYLKSLK
jgi:cytochrome c